MFRRFMLSADEGEDAAELTPPNPKSGRLSHVDRERMLAMHAAGSSPDEIAQATQRTTGLVQKTLTGAAPERTPKKKKTSPSPRRRRAAEPVPAAPPPARPARAAADAPAPDAGRRHRFWLRAEFQVELALPANLRAQEAQRLAQYLQSLPFGNLGLATELDPLTRSRVDPIGRSVTAPRLR